MVNTLNVLMVTPFYPPHIGGIEYHVQNLSKNLIKNGHSVVVLTSMPSDMQLKPYEKTSENMEIFRLTTIFPKGQPYLALASQGITLKNQVTIRRIVERRNIDIIHVHGHHYFINWRAIDISKTLKKPSVLTLHGLYALNPSDSLAEIGEEIFNYTIFKRELHNVKAVIGLTSVITMYAKKYGPKVNKYFTIPNGIDYTNFTSNYCNKSNYREKYGIRDDQIVVLFRGRFASVKGVIELAAAANLVLKRKANIVFYFVGGGPLINELIDALKPLGVNARILTWLPFNEIHELYIASDIFILPSKSEALPITILEAMAAQLPIIATQTGGIPEVLRKYPKKILIMKPVPSEICNAIIAMIEQKGQKKFALENISEYLYLYNWSRIATQVENVYRIISR
jgi:D-inositol-3-phosphate glycosyltransferase